MTEFTEKERTNVAGPAGSAAADDPSGQFPSSQYFYKSNTNIAATGETRNSLKWATIPENIGENLLKENVNSIYPFNQVDQSITGHIYEVDDTPGNERVLINHADGAGIELGVDGSVAISALGNRIEVTGGNQYITIVGDANIVYQGNLDMKVAGEFNIDCNEFNVNVKNNKTEVIGGAETREVYKGSTNSVIGNTANFVTGQVSDTFLGGHQHNIKGNLDYNINGDIGIYSSGSQNITSEDYINMSSDYLIASANNMTIQGGNGVIGGDSVHIKGQEASFEGSVEAPTFYGNLIGKAKFAALADKATGATTAGSTGSSGTANYPADPGEPSFVEPSTSKVSSYLSKAAGGIRKVKIDIGDYLKNFLDRSKRYDGIATQTMTAKAARSKLRDAANRNNSKFISSLVEEGILCEDYNNPTPAAVGRIVDGDTTTFHASEFASAANTTDDVIFITRNIVKQFLPDPLYNPINLGRGTITSITAKTKIAPNTSLSKFLGTEDPVNIKYIRNEETKRQIAKHLYLQTLILQNIQNNQRQFEGVALEITEGLYRPGNGEKITAESINDLKSRGRAVVYKAVDSQGKSNPSRLFDIAVHLKDTGYFDQLILSYDTNECINGQAILSARLIVVMPKIDDNYVGTFRREVFTEFNSNKLSQGELVECLSKKINAPVNPNLVVSDIGVHDLDPKTRPELRKILIQSASQVGVKLVSGYTQVPIRGLRPAGTSGRHNTGYAHDVSLVYDGRILQPFVPYAKFSNDQNDLDIVKKFSKAFYENAYAAGYKPSIGWGPNYMEGIRGHFDIAAGIAIKPSTGKYVVQSRWGDSGKGANAPDFLREIYGY